MLLAVVYVLGLNEISRPSTYIKMQRPTPGNGYLECITDVEKCSVSFSPIAEVTANGILTADGNETPIDVLVCATVFDVSFRPRYPIVGKNGLDLAEAWEKAPETYLSVTAPNFPNYFSTSGEIYSV
jgi:cation diffusion facilitator CzcD-associated flavoprotein CzcO